MATFPFHDKFDEVFKSNAKWYIKYLWLILFLVVFFGALVLKGTFKGEEKLIVKNWWSLVGFFFFFTGSLFFFMQSSDWMKRRRNVFLKLLIAIFYILLLIIWLIVVCVWIMHILGI